MAKTFDYDSFAKAAFINCSDDYRAANRKRPSKYIKHKKRTIDLQQQKSKTTPRRAF